MTTVRWQRKLLVQVTEIWEADIEPHVLDTARKDNPMVFDMGDLDELVTCVGTMQESTITGSPVDNALEYEEVVE